MVAADLPFVALEGHGLRLEPYDPAHLPGLTAALGRPEVFAGGWGGGPAGARTGDDFAAWLPTYLPVGRAHVYVVRSLSVPDAAPPIIGTSTILDLAPAAESAHIGYTAYAPETWGSSVNPAAKLLLLGHLFDHGYGRVKLQADVRNARSRAGIEKLGAQFEGVARRDAQRADGSWRDAAVYSIVVDEWPAVRDGLLERLGELEG
ncbi:GNAT family N-acetyltransferase [Microcella humidisoli]|uniref:GNAT family N-acetyltransferase n=1 Tax=Microcella humidisoli TaxID=2963406 RepID=A0ABY5FZX0_9MICO|nr:GNAT family protein [Microcella humidisoli]UTT63395.1 GNAT family N-acetyltransferase [Microcella humidisoli]